MSTYSDLVTRLDGLVNKNNAPFDSSELGLIKDILDSINAGDIGGGGQPTTLTLNTEFDTGRTLDGSAIYGKYGQATRNTVPSIVLESGISVLIRGEYVFDESSAQTNTTGVLRVIDSLGTKQAEYFVTSATGSEVINYYIEYTKP